MKSLSSKLFFSLQYFAFWVLYFVIARVFFLLFYFDKTKDIGLENAFKTISYGLQLDLSFTGYLCIPPFLLLTVSSFLNQKSIAAILRAYTAICVIVISLFLMLDLGLYKAWGVRIDNSFLNYLNTPELMLASTSTSQLVSGLLGWLITAFLFIKLYKNKVQKTIFTFKNKAKIRTIIVFLIGTVALIIPVRGGFQTIPVNQSNVYFSNQMFANHAAVNFIWNFFNTLKRTNDGTNPYKAFDTLTAQNISDYHKNTLLTSDEVPIFTVEKPNVILIVWESLSAKVVGSLNGEKGVTPNLNRLSKEGILFTNFYSNGDRTDKGIPAILSGYYPQPSIRIMRMPNKTRNLPMLPKAMKKLGYKTSFYYGGDLNFGNMNTYLRNAAVDEIVDGSVFDKKDWNSKWGAFDDVFMKRFAEDLNKETQQPFFKVALTLTSHEPFEIKGDYKFGQNNEPNLYRSAHFYTDKVIGDFISFAKKQDWYKNTLIVIMSDHGHSLPTPDQPYFGTKKFHIPMLWLGGALTKKGYTVDAISSQVDFSYTLLNLLNTDASEFIYGKNIFNKSSKQYAHYTFNKGFGTLNSKDTIVFDYISKKPILTSKNSSAIDSLGKALTQLSYQDFLER